MAALSAPLRQAARIAVAMACGILIRPGSGLAFPELDTRSSAVPTGTELAAPDARDLRNQLQIVNGLSAPVGGGWTILPRLGIQGMLTDNALQVQSPRSWDIASFISPGVTIVGETTRASLRLDYAPVLSLYARNSSQNGLAQQLNATGQVVLVPELAFVDVRALAGVQARNGGIGGLGTLGTASASPIAAGGFGNATGNNLGLSRQNQIQTGSFGISPYLTHRFGDYGVGRIGLGLNASRSSSIAGFGTIPVVTSGTNPQNQFTAEQTARFTSGEILGRIQDTVDVYISQTTTSGQFSANGTPNPNANNSTSNSTRQTISNRITYAINTSLSVFASLGYENIQYSNALSQQIKGITWQLGTTWTPNPDSTVSVSYGRQEGAESLTLNANYAVSARTSTTLSYNSRLGTQLQNLQRQLDAGTVGTNGSLVNSQTGAPLFTGTNSLGVDPGLYRFDTFTAGLNTTLERDQFSFNLTWTTQTATGGGTPSGNSGTSKTASIQWVRQLRPDLSFSAYVGYSLNNGGGVNGTGGNQSGNSPSIAASASLQYTFTETLSGVVRYSYFDRSSSTAGLTMYQNLVIVGVTKQF